MKMISKVLIPIIMALIITGCGTQNEGIPETSNTIEQETVHESTPEVTNTTNQENINEGTVEGEEVVMNSITLTVNDHEFEVELEDNSATVELLSKLKDGDIVINASEYGGFEKVGSLGFSLPREDKQITTEAGDIVLYQGNQISLFYNSNSWSYTKLGKIQNVSSSELKSILGSGDVTLVFSLSK